MNAHTKKFLGGALLMVIVASCVGAAKAPTPEQEARNQRLLFVSNVQMALEGSLKDPGSVQYIRKAIHLKQINAPVLTFDFFEMKNGVKKFVSFNAKRARGLMASYIIKNKIIHPDQLKTFSAEGYQYVPSDSQENHYTFTKV